MDQVACSECGTRYDSDANPFCPRCGSTARGTPMPAALDVARRNDPARRRVQAAGVMMAAIGLLFLVSSLATFAVTRGELPAQFADMMADQPGGTLVLLPAGNASFDATVATMDGAPVANATSQAGPWTVDLGAHAAVKVQATWANGTRNGTAIVIAGDRLELAVDRLDPDQPVASPSVRTVNRVGTGLALATTLLLMAGGLCALLLRLWPLAATAAVVSLLLAVFALFFFLLPGLLFALPFGFAAYFVLRGRRHFRRKPAA